MPSMTSDGWKKQGQLVRQEPWLCVQGTFLRKAFTGVCGTFAGTGRNQSMPKL